MSSRATSLEPKSQFTIILALRRKQKKKGNPQSKEREKTKKERKFPIKRAGENKKRKFPIEEWEKAKKGKKIPDQRSEEKQKKYTERSLDQITSKTIQSCHQVNKKGKETTI